MYCSSKTTKSFHGFNASAEHVTHFTKWIVERGIGHQTAVEVPYQTVEEIVISLGYWL